MTSQHDLENILIPFFRNRFPDPETELDYSNVFELTVSVILSAQCTDKRVNLITPAFFKHFPDFSSLASSSVNEIYELIKSCSYPNNKSKNLLALAKKIMIDYQGNFPSDPDEMEKLPGIGRKSANVISAVAFKLNRMPVDTHVFRVAQRIGLVSPSKTPFEVEKKLLEVLPENILTDFHHWLILHGRYICQARKPKCTECGLIQVCTYPSKKLN